MNKKVFVSSLVIETTRRCNANCAHCLRGNGENCDINFDYIEKLLENVEYVGNITFSGGEPTLNVNIIGLTLDYVKEHNISVESVYVVTNGLHYSQKLVTYMKRWLSYCCECTGYENIWWERDCYDDDNIYKSEDLTSYLENYGFGLCVSIDKFHPTPSNYAMIRYRNLPFYLKDKETTYTLSNTIAQGRAKENGVGTRELAEYNYEFSFLNEYFDEDDEISVELVYLNCYGKVLPCCDFSYATQDSTIGNNFIMDRSLSEIVLDESILFINGDSDEEDRKVI